ncbi:cytokine receptor-like, partial [Tropilaelaps mercedesae]
MEIRHKLMLAYDILPRALVLLFTASMANACKERCNTLTHCYNMAIVDMPQTLPVEVGREIRLNCPLLSDMISLNSSPHPLTVNASNLHFKRSDQPVSILYESNPYIEKVNEMTIAFVKQNATVDDAGTYACEAVVGEVHYPGCDTRVEVGVKPREVTDFLCTSIKFMSMTCSWKNPDNGQMKTTYAIEVIRGLGAFNVSVSCPRDMTTSNSCTWTRASDPYYEVFADKFRFKITGSNSLGSVFWEYVLEHYAIVQLPPVIDLRIRNVTQRSVAISWKPPAEADIRINALADQQSTTTPLKLVYEVELRRHGGSASLVERLDTATFFYDKLVPNVEYEVRVRCWFNMVRRPELYSNPTISAFKTNKDKPQRPPSIHPSGFQYRRFLNHRTVILLFEELSRDDWNDDQV